MIPTLEYHIDCHGPEMFEEPVGWPACDHRLAPCQHAEPRGGMECEASILSVIRTLARVSLPCPKLCSRLYPLFFSTLKVSFSIFHLARPQAAMSATLAAVTSRSVTKLLKYVRLPLLFRISMENQLTIIASVVARSGTPDSQR